MGRHAVDESTARGRAHPADVGSSEGERALLILAVDQRSSLERGVFGLEGAVSPGDAASISGDKLLVYQALLDALPGLPDAVQPGILVDEEYGASVAELAGRPGAAVSLAMPVEKSGDEWFDFAYGEHWMAHAGFFGTDLTKVLVRDNPGSDPSRRERQAAQLAEVAQWAASNGRSFMVELLAPASDGDLATVDGDAARYDREIRPGHTVEAIGYLQDHGVEPAIWKVEGVDRREDAERIVDAAHRGGRTADCLLLGRHAPAEQLDAWIRVVAPTPGWIGFAIGRSIWWDALSDRRRLGRTEAETRRRVSRAYLEFVHRYSAARRGAPVGASARGAAPEDR